MMIMKTFPTKLQCNLAASFLSSILFSFLTIGFSTALLASRKLVKSEISFYFHTSRFHNKEVIIGGEIPSLICLFASIFYAGLGFISFKNEWNELSSRLGETIDAIFFPLLLCALVMLTDFLHIIFMVSLYIIFSLTLTDLSINIRDAKTHILWVLIISFCSFWTGFTTGLIFNWTYSKPGSGVAEFISFLIIGGYDAYRTIRLGKHFDYDSFCKTLVRFVLLMCVFIEEVGNE